MNDLIEKIDNNRILKTVRPFFTQGYLVGGFLRDLVLNKESCDLDFVVKKDTAKPLALLIAEKLDAHFVSLDEVNKIYRVVMSDKITYIDIAECLHDTIEEDLRRRDFTINSLGYDLKNSKLLDVTGALNDLNARIISPICEKNITDDPLRILRAYRFQAELGFEPSQELKAMIQRHAPDLNKSAKERINVELVKLFAGQNALEALYSMDETGVLASIFPIISELKKIPPNSHHHLNLFEHSLETVNQVAKYCESAPESIKEHFESTFFGAQKRIGYLKIAAFLHDIGKPQTWFIEPETNRHRFIKHDDVGSKLVVEILKNLKFSKKQIKYIQKLIKFHIYPANVVTGENFTEKSMMRFFRKMEDEVFDVIAIAHSDRLSALGPEITEDIVNKNINGLKTLTERFIELKNEMAPLPKLIDGNEIMQILNIKGGPQLGEIINALNEAQIAGDISTREDAIEFIKKV